MEEVTISPIIELPELTQDWGNCWRTQTKPCVHQDQDKRAVTPQETDPDLPVVSRNLWLRHGLAVACCRVGGTECGSAWDLLKELTIIFINSATVRSQVKQQGGNTAQPINTSALVSGSSCPLTMHHLHFCHHGYSIMHLMCYHWDDQGYKLTEGSYRSHSVYFLFSLSSGLNVL